MTYNKHFKIIITEHFLRIDKFLNAVNLTKRRAVAKDMVEEGVVYINDKAVKPSKNVAVGDIITLVYLEKQMRYEVLSLPTIKSTPKSQQHLYVKELA
jgi:ribosome-associated heat shock protein Hsp15